MHNDKGAAPPFPVWKLVLLLISTAGLYQFVWLYQTATNLNIERKLPLTPWHWAVVPLLGPFASVPGHNLATRIKEWQMDSHAEIGHFSEPVFIALFFLVAYLPLGLLIIDSKAAPSFVVAAILASCFPYLALQGQINLNRRKEKPSVKPSRFTGRHGAIIAGGALLAAPVYVYTLTDFVQLRGSTTLAMGDIVGQQESFFQMRVGDNDWKQLEPGYISNESNLEFLGPDDQTWAVVYDASGQDVDNILAFRVDEIKTDYRGANCRQQKSLIPESLIVLGTVECTGRNAIQGNYVFMVRILSDRTRTAEIVASTAQFDTSRFEEYALRLRNFVDGLELMP